MDAQTIVAQNTPGMLRATLTAEGESTEHLGAEVSLEYFLQTLGCIDVHGERHEAFCVFGILV
jgi:hypothetical protein